MIVQFKYTNNGCYGYNKRKTRKVKIALEASHILNKDPLLHEMHQTC